MILDKLIEILNTQNITDDLRDAFLKAYKAYKTQFSKKKVG